METNGNNRPYNKPGLYRHPESGAEVIVRHHPRLGAAMADGAVAQGYVWVGPAPADEEAVKPATEAKAPEAKK